MKLTKLSEQLDQFQTKYQGVIDEMDKKHSPKVEKMKFSNKEHLDQYTMALRLELVGRYFLIFGDNITTTVEVASMN